MENHIKMDDLGVPLFSETSILESRVKKMEFSAPKKPGDSGLQSGPHPKRHDGIQPQ